MTQSNRAKNILYPSLTFVSGDLLTVSLPLEREEVILGRALEVDVRINDSRVERQHAKISIIREETGEAVDYVLTDLNSSVGTLLNGEKVKEASLQRGDKIAIGQHILRFDLLDEIDREYQQKIRRLIAHDDLTGLLSSRSFFSELNRETSRAMQENRSLCVLMMDIDFFKNVNDTYGHLTGSNTLEELGSCITGILRNGDVASRFGGEEFAAFLLDAGLSQGLIAAERIRSVVENYKFTVIKNGKPAGTHHITMSIGVSSFPECSSDPIELVDMADSALYNAKNLGRNRVCSYRDMTDDEAKAPLPPRSEF